MSIGSWKARLRRRMPGGPSSERRTADGRGPEGLVSQGSKTQLVKPPRVGAPCGSSPCRQC
eukprot:15452708-Alexandrium_andersonii.AAC.1